MFPHMSNGLLAQLRIITLGSESFRILNFVWTASNFTVTIRHFHMIHHMVSLIENTSLKATYSVIQYALAGKQCKEMILFYFILLLSGIPQSQIILNPPFSDSVSDRRASQHGQPGTCLNGPHERRVSHQLLRISNLNEHSSGETLRKCSHKSRSKGFLIQTCSL